MEERHGLRVEVSLDETWDLENQETRSLVVNLVRELLFNSVKHSGVDRARIYDVVSEKERRLIVEDAGCGFDVAAVRARRGERSLGLFSIEERLRLVGGRFELHSVPGQGTCCVLAFPLQTPSPAITGLQVTSDDTAPPAPV